MSKKSKLTGDPVRLLQTLQEFFSSDSDRQDRILRKHPELLSDETLVTLQTLQGFAGETGDEEAAFLFSEIRSALENLRNQQGVVPVPAPPVEERVPTELQALMLGAVNAMQRYQEEGSVPLLDEAVGNWQRLVNHPLFNNSDLTFRLNALNDFAVTHLTRYRAMGRLDDLNAALHYLEQGAAATPENSPGLADRLSNLGAVLSSRYDHMGQMDDLERAIDLYHRALQTARVGRSQAAIYRNSLGIALLKRFHHTGDLQNLLVSIATLEEALADAPSNRPAGAGIVADRALILSNLGNALRARYQMTDDVSDLERSCGHLEEALRLRPTASPDRPLMLGNLAFGLWDLYQQTRETAYLKRTIELLEEAVQLSPAGSNVLPSHMTGLAMALRTRAEQSQDLSDLDRAVSLAEQAAQLISDDSPRRADSLFQLGCALNLRYERTGDHSDYQKALAAYRESSDSGLLCNVEGALNGARGWADMAFLASDWEEAAEGYEVVHRLSQRLLEIRLVRDEWELWLRKTQSLSDRCAYALARSGDLQRAAIALERGHARLLDITLDEHRQTFAQLKSDKHAETYRRLHDSMEHWSELSSVVERTRGAAPERSPDAAALSWADQAVDRALEEVRALPGFEGFLVPPGFETLRRAAASSPLVYLAVTAAGGLGVIVTPEDTVSPLWLPELTTDAVIVALFGGDADDDQIEPERFLTAYRLRHLDQALWLQALDTMTRWLWRVLVGPLLDALQPASDAVIVPSGALSLLPLHAAWTEDSTAPTGRRYALDSLVFTFAPSARSLVGAREVAARASTGGVLVVSDPAPTQAPPLPHAPVEAQLVLAQFEDGAVLEHEHASKTAVLRAIPEHSVLHFGCHALADLFSPLKSHLLMANSETISLKDLLSVESRDHRLAVLSACETGIPGLQLPDEIVSLSTGFLGAGAAGVVSSLWSVADLSTAMLMARFYELWKGRDQTPSRALRNAQIWLRDTTNGEKEAYFSAMGGAAEGIGEALRGAPENRHGCAHPFHWGAFQYVGA